VYVLSRLNANAFHFVGVGITGDIHVGEMAVSKSGSQWTRIVRFCFAGYTQIGLENWFVNDRDETKELFNSPLVIWYFKQAQEMPVYTDLILTERGRLCFKHIG
jgi:hypothetical protein